MAGIPGVVSYYPNNHVSSMKNAIWTSLLGLLGKEGGNIMLEMILKCGIFIAVSTGRENYYQLCGELHARFDTNWALTTS